MRVLRKLTEAPAGRDLIATVVISVIVTLVVSVALVVNIYNRIDTRIDQNNQAICAVFTTASSPPPRPPELTEGEQPRTASGKAILDYQEKQAKWAADLRADMARLVRTYNC